MNDREREIAAALPENLDGLPRLDGFRLRGIEMTRLETFIDAAFAFAITILAIAAGNVPETIDTLLAAFRNVPAFIASVFVVGIFWRGHWLWSRRYGLEDGISTLISWGVIVTILIYVYPLRALFGSLSYFLSNGQLGHPLFGGTERQARTLLAVYALGFVALSLELLLLYLRAWKLREALRLNPREEAMTIGQVRGWRIPLGVGLLSLIFAIVLPVKYLDFSGWIYFSLAVLVPVYRRWTSNKRERLEREQPRSTAKKDAPEMDSGASSKPS